MRYLLLIVTFFILNASSAKADIEFYDFDKAHTQILFFVDHLGFSKSQGEFHTYDGSFMFNRDEPQKSKIDITIQTNSIDMDDEKWNEHMKNADFFDVEKFPTMSFKSSSIDVQDKKKALINGELTILGVTKHVVLDVVFNKADKHMFSGKYVAGFSAQAKVKRSDFNMNYGLPMIGDDVDIMIEVEGIRRDGGGGTYNQ